jgi:GNAT superfamily N-acetyltransferase
MTQHGGWRLYDSLLVGEACASLLLHPLRLSSTARRGEKECSMSIDYDLEPALTVDEFRSVLIRSTLAERRPIDRDDILQGMLDHADLIVTARSDGQLVGVVRAITDFSYCTYLSDLAVDEAFQRQGIGRELIHRLHAAAGLQTMLILLAAPKARGYYPHIGLEPHDSCWTIPRRIE